MNYEIIISNRACRDYETLDRHWQATIWGALKVFLTREPTKISKSHIKRLREMRHPQFRLRVGDMRVFYDVEGQRVEILAICTKEEAQSYLKEEGIRDDDDTTD